MRTQQQLCIAVLGIWFSAAGLAQDVEDYRAFKDEDIYDSAMTNEAANAMVEVGIVSDNPEIVDLTLRALSELAVFHVSGLPHPSNPLPERAFNEVIGLKPLLIERYLRELEHSGSNTREVTLRSLEAEQERRKANPTVMSQIFSEKARDFANEIHGYHRYMEDLNPVWLTIPKILCAFWPGDADVHEFIWNAHAVDRSPGMSITTLARLNDCRFTTYEANSFRMSQLQLAQSSDKPEASATAMIASDGFALSHPPEALPLLIEAGMEWPQARRQVFGALGGYSDADLDAHAEALGELMRDTSSLLPYEPELSQVIDRLQNRYE